MDFRGAGWCQGRWREKMAFVCAPTPFSQLFLEVTKIDTLRRHQNVKLCTIFLAPTLLKMWEAKILSYLDVGFVPLTLPRSAHPMHSFNPITTGRANGARFVANLFYPK